MQLFVDESGRFNIKDSGRFNVVAGLALPELPPFVMDIVARQIAELVKRAPACWKKKGELKGALIPTDDLRRFLKPILDIQGPVLVAAAFIDSSYQVSSQVDAYKTNQLTTLEREKLRETDPERRQKLAEEIGLVNDASGVVLMRSYVALPHVVVGTIVQMQAYYPTEFWPALERLEVIVDRTSFLENRLDRQRVVKQRVLEELQRHGSQWGFKELRQWHDLRLQHPGERLASRQGSPGSWRITLEYDLNADEAGRPLMLLGDFVAAAIRRDLEAATETITPEPIVCANRRVFPVLTVLGTLSDAKQKEAGEGLAPLFAKWGAHSINETE